MAKKARTRATPAASNRRLPRHVPVWRYYFINRHVANLIGFYIVLLIGVIATSNILYQYLPYGWVFTLHALFVVWVSHYYWFNYLSKQPRRDYGAGA